MDEAHEIGHSLLPWHEDMMLGDNVLTTSQDCMEEIEAEANYAAGRLLFLRDHFSTQALSLVSTIASVRQLHGKFGNTLSTTLYRFVETVGSDRPLIGMITGHPHVSRRGANFDSLKPCRHFIRSAAFIARFWGLGEQELFAAVASCCGAQSGGPLGENEIVLRSNNGDLSRFRSRPFSTAMTRSRLAFGSGIIVLFSLSPRSKAFRVKGVSPPGPRWRAVPRAGW